MPRSSAKGGRRNWGSGKVASLPLEQIDVPAAERASPGRARTPKLTVQPWAQVIDAAFVAQWDALANNPAQPNPFYESWFLRPGLVHWGQDVELACIWQDSRLIGLWPLRQSGMYYRYPVPHLAGWLHPNAFCGAPLVAAGHECAFWKCLLEWADSSPGLNMFLHLRDLPQDGQLYAALCEVIAEQSRPAAIVMQEDRALLQSSDTPAAYFEASMSGKKRKELRRQYNRLSEEGDLAFNHDSSADGVRQWAKDFMALERRGWKGEQGSALGCDPATGHLFSEAVTGAAERGKLERLTLSLDGKPIAMLANFIAKPGAFSFKTAFDEQYSRFSPGVLLQRENLELLARDDVDWCDSCAAADHPMIERIWREKRSIVRVNIGIGGLLRRTLCRQFLRAEDGTNVEVTEK